MSEPDNDDVRKLIERLRAAHETSRQRVLGSNIFSEAATALSSLLAWNGELEAERKRVVSFLSDAGYETVQSEQAWKRRALAAESHAAKLEEALAAAAEA